MDDTRLVTSVGVVREYIRPRGPTVPLSSHTAIDPLVKRLLSVFGPGDDETEVRSSTVGFNFWRHPRNESSPLSSI